jgi:hypothetical protein
VQGDQGHRHSLPGLPDDPCTIAVNRCTFAVVHHQPEERAMSKGMDQKKTEKKKPEKNLKEKRAAKKEKKAGK